MRDSTQRPGSPGEPNLDRFAPNHSFEKPGRGRPGKLTEVDPEDRSVREVNRRSGHFDRDEQLRRGGGYVLQVPSDIGPPQLAGGRLPWKCTY